VYIGWNFVREYQSDNAVEFVYVPHGCNSKIILAYPAAIAQSGAAVIAAAGVDF